MGNKRQPHQFSDALGRYGERHKPADLNEPTVPGASPPPDELAASIQASVAEIAVMWILHSWSHTRERLAEPLDQQIKNFSAAALGTIAAHCPMLRNAKQEHLWMIYFKGLLAADTHPREQMIKAIRTVRERSWIQEPAEVAADTAVKPTLNDLSDLDALEHITQALSAD